MGSAGNIFSLMGDFDEMIREGKAKMVWHDCWDNKKDKHKEITLKLSELKNGDYFKFVDEIGDVRSPVHQRIRGINQSSVEVDCHTDVFKGIKRCGLSANSASNVVKVDKPFTEAKQEVVKSLTFGDLKVGDEFNIIEVYNGDKQSFEKIAPYKDKHGYWVNAKLVKTKPSYFCFNLSEIILLDQQEVELVEEKLTIADLKPGEKFSVQGGTGEVYTKVHDHFQLSDQCFYMDKTFHIITTSRGTMVVKLEPKESATEVGDKQYLTLGDMKKGDKFKILFDEPLRNSKAKQPIYQWMRDDFSGICTIKTSGCSCISKEDHDRQVFVYGERGRSTNFSAYMVVKLVENSSPEKTE